MGGRIEQAYFGESGGGHRLLAASSPQDPIFRALAATTDHLSAPEHRLVWSPYLSGYPLQDRYIVSRTFPGQVTTRAGWAFTHVLVLPTAAAAEIPHLGSLLRLLATEASVTTPVPIPFPEEQAPRFAPPSPRVGAAVRALLERREGARPVVWLGQEGVEDLLERIWAGLWPAARSAFAFRTAFRPDDADRKDTALFATPVAQPALWAGFTVVRQDVSDAELSPAEATLAGSASPLTGRIAALAPTGTNLEVLRQIEAIDAALRSLESLPAADTRMLVRRLAAISPAPETAAADKAAALRHLADAIPTAESSFVYTLRNVPHSPFGSAFAAVGEAVTTWIRLHLPGAEASVAEWLTISVGEALEWWRTAVTDGVRVRLKEGSSTSARVLWVMWRARPDTVAALATTPEVAALADGLSEAAPRTLTRDVAERVLRVARDHGWTKLYAAAATAALPISEALDALVQTFPAIPDEALRAVALRVPAADVVRTVAARGDLVFDAWVGQMIAGDPRLRAELQPNLARGRALWLRSSSASADVWTGIDDIPAWRDAVLVAAAEQEPDASALLHLIARTPAADLSGTPWESRAWSFLPRAVAADYLQATARGWVARFRADSKGTPVPASPLRDQIVRDRTLLGASPAHAEDDLATGITAMERFELSEAAATGWLQANASLLPRLRTVDAERLGLLIRSSGWRDAARRVYDIRSRAPVLATALHHCSGLLSAFEQLRLVFEGSGSPAVPREEWYRLLHAFLSDNLYRGPEHDGVWERAGGKLAQIGGYGASERWWDALRLIRSGTAQGKVTLHRLLQVLGEEYPRNEHLHLLRDTAPHD